MPQGNWRRGRRRHLLVEIGTVETVIISQSFKKKKKKKKERERGGNLENSTSTFQCLRTTIKLGYTASFQPYTVSQATQAVLDAFGDICFCIGIMCQCYSTGTIIPPTLDVTCTTRWMWTFRKKKKKKKPRTESNEVRHPFLTWDPDSTCPFHARLTSIKVLLHHI